MGTIGKPSLEAVATSLIIDLKNEADQISLSAGTGHLVAVGLGTNDAKYYVRPQWRWSDTLSVPSLIYHSLQEWQTIAGSKSPAFCLLMQIEKPVSFIFSSNWRSKSILERSVQRQGCIFPNHKAKSLFIQKDFFDIWHCLREANGMTVRPMGRARLTRRSHLWDDSAHSDNVLLPLPCPQPVSANIVSATDSIQSTSIKSKVLCEGAVTIYRGIMNLLNRSIADRLHMPSLIWRQLFRGLGRLSSNECLGFLFLPR